MRAIFVALGAICVVLGAVGTIVPGLPTTPFLLLAATCFARGSRRAHAWILRNRVFGPIIRTWQRERAVSRRVKGVSSVMVIAAVIVSMIWGVHALPLRIMLAAIGTVGLVVLLSLPTSRPVSRTVERDAQGERQPPQSPEGSLDP